MEMDRQLLDGIEGVKDPILHLYDWQGDSATYGHFIQIEKYINLQGAAKRSLSLAKRPTGGGIIFHITDYAFSALVPASHPFFSLNTLENYAFINGIAARAVERLTGRHAATTLLESPPKTEGMAQFFCMGKPTIYDVMIDGKKIGGAAQRKTKAGFLHQGSIAIGMPCDSYLHDVLLDKGILDAMHSSSYLLASNTSSKQEIESIRLALKQLLIEEVQKM
jgi:lipoate-protein ligase A